MKSRLLIFLAFVVLYHVIVTIFSFWLHRVPPYSVLVLREGLWFIWFAWVVMAYRALVHERIRRRWVPLMRALVLLVVSFGTSIALGVDVKHILVWTKYTLYYIVPFLTAIFIGMAWWSQSHDAHDAYEAWRVWETFIRGLWRLTVGILIVWWVWQTSKYFLPDFFHHLGYGPLGDYVFGQRPPLYYLTGSGGVMRRSGIFSGPNNYGYFLVATFGLYRYGIKQYLAKPWLKKLARGLFVMTLLATLSRGAIMGVLVQIVMISYVAYNAKRKVIVSAVIAGILAVGALSALKWESTRDHLIAKINSMHYVQESPLGYGLGSSWPSALSQGGIIPENHFVQLMMDLGVHGFIIRSIFWLSVMMSVRRIYINGGRYRSIVFYVTVGFVWLMLEWLFLHVLEDSMVNYWYFVVRGVVIGYVGMMREVE
jgi:hypothetical protein